MLAVFTLVFGIPPITPPPPPRANGLAALCMVGGAPDGGALGFGALLPKLNPLVVAAPLLAVELFAEGAPPPKTGGADAGTAAPFPKGAAGCAAGTAELLLLFPKEKGGLLLPPEGADCADGPAGAAPKGEGAVFVDITGAPPKGEGAGSGALVTAPKVGA